MAAAVAELKELKAAEAALQREFEEVAGGSGGSGANREAFRAKVQGALERRLFYMQAFKIYGGVAGLYDYGPPGCTVKNNMIQFWRRHFVLEENMLELECSAVTPEPVLRASGHVDRFTDLMVKDEVTKDCHRADHLLEDLLEKKLATPIPADERAAIKDVLARIDEHTAAELGGYLKQYGAKAPETGNPISDPFPFNLMFQTSIGPRGDMKGFLRPETAQGIFVNFKDLLYFNGNKLPFAGAQIGQSYRNEISPQQGLLRVREFTQCEIEHFCHPERKNAHPKYKDVEDLEFLFYPQAEQLGKAKKAVTMRVGDAVDRGIVDNKTLAYFIARTYLYLVAVGVDPARLRFRQHLANEMAHYAKDCWDAEVECTYGWVECVGVADRSAFDLNAHGAASKTELTAYEEFETPKEVEVVEVEPVKKEMGKAFKRNAKVVMDALAGMSDEAALKLKAELAANGTAALKAFCDGADFEITAAMVKIEQKTKKLRGHNFTPTVIEPSFGIGRIMYCMFEHTFYTREGDDDAKTVFRFTPLVAPIKCTVNPLMQKEELVAPARALLKEVLALGVAAMLDTTGTSIGKRYARTDEIGVPFAVTIDYDTLKDGTVTLRERDSTAQVRLPVAAVPEVLKKMVEGSMGFAELSAAPAPVAGAADAPAGGPQTGPLLYPPSLSS